MLKEKEPKRKGYCIVIDLNLRFESLSALDPEKDQSEKLCLNKVTS
jgi:hypothetical protein